MAKQVADLTVNLDIKGYEKLESLKGAFKGLQAAIAPATQDIDLARAAILRFGETNTTTVRLVQAQVNGLKNLREQVDINGTRYRQLGADIDRLQAKVAAANNQIAAQTTVLERGSRVFGVNIDTLKRYTAGLESTRTVLNKTATSVDTTTAAVNKLGDAISKTQSLKLDVGAGTPGGPLAGTRNAIQQTIALFQRLGQQSRTAVGQVGRVTEGLAATAGVSLLGKVGAGAAAGAAGLGAGGLSDLAGRITGLEQFLNRMPGAAGSKVLGGLTEPLMGRVQELTALQGKMAALQATSDSFVSAFSQLSPAATAATVAVAASFAVLKDQVDKQLNGLAADFEQSFTAMSDDVQRVLVALTRLGDQLGRLSKYEIGQLYGQAMQGFQAVPAGSPRSRSFASQLAGLGQLNERETAAQLDVLEEYRLRVTGAETSVNSLGARLSYLNDRLKHVNTSTVEGRARYAEIRAEIVNTQKQVDALARSYSHVSDAARQAVQASTGFVSPFTVAGGRNPEYVGARQQAVNEATMAYKAAMEEVDAVQRNYAINLADNALKAALLEIEIEEDRARQVSAIRQRESAEADKNLRAELDRLDMLRQQRAAAVEAMQLRGPISPFYESVLGLSTAGVARQQMFGGRDATTVFNDIANSFAAGGRSVDLTQRSTQIGQSLGEGVTQGFRDQLSNLPTAKNAAEVFFATYKRIFRIKSPSQESRDKIGLPLGQGIGQGIVDGLKQMRTQIRAAINDAMAAPGRAPLPGAMGPASDLADTMQSYLARSTARTSTYLPFARLLGEAALQSQAIPLSVYRRNYERGGIVPATYLPVEARRGLRGTPGIPGAGLEEILRAEAIATAGRTGAFFGPLAGPRYAGVFQGTTLRSPGALSTVPSHLLPVSRPLFTPGAAAQQMLDPGGALGSYNLFFRPRALRNVLEATQARIEAQRQARMQSGFAEWSQNVPDYTAPYTPPPAYLIQQRIEAQRQARMQSGFAEWSRSVGGGGGGGTPPGTAAGLSAPGPANNLEAVNTQLARFGDLSKRSTADLRALSAVLRDFGDNLDPLDDQYNRINKAIERQDALIERELGRRGQRRQRVTGMQLAQAAGAAVSGGIFGGFEGFAGGAIGGIIGAGTPAGPVGGAFAGAAIGAQVGMIRQQVGAVTAYAAEIRQLQIALTGVVTSFEDYKTALAATEQISTRFNQPLRESTQRFTQLSAAVIGSGGTIDEAKTTFNNITAAIIATGGSTEQVNAALTATAQVFSKGKVTAEELRGQLGERLPGAFALFAQSMNISTQQLDKLLDEGKVTIPDFLRFVQSLGDKYGETADRMAKSSEQAGARMGRAFEGLQVTVGNALGPTGAMFQDFFTNVINFADKAIKKLIEFNILKPGAGYEVAQVLTGGASESALQSEYARLKSEQQLASYRDREYRESLRNPRVQVSRSGGTTTTAIPDQREAAGVTRARDARIAVLEEALTRLGVIRAATEAGKAPAKPTAAETAQQEAQKREQRAKQYLDAIEQRETSLLDARRDYEEQIRDIRKNALREAEQLERGFADERRQIEREVRDIRTQRADTAEDNERRLRIARGENADVVNAAQRVADIYREERDANQAMSDRIADAERTQARTIADFQRKTAEDIGKANEAYAKRVGEIQRKFAQEHANILDEGSKRQAARISIASQLIAKQQARAVFVKDLWLPTIYKGASPVYGVNADLSAQEVFNRINTEHSDDQQMKAAYNLDIQIGRLTERLVQLNKAAPLATSAAVRPSTPAPNLGRAPALPGAAQTTAARSELAAESRAANAAERRGAMQVAFAESIAALPQRVRELQQRRQEESDVARLIQRGYTETLARQLRELRTLSVAAFDKLSGTYREQLDKIGPADTEALADAERLYKAQSDALRASFLDAERLTLEIERQNELLRYQQDMRIGVGATEGLREYITTMGTAREASKQLALTGIKGVENAIVELATTGTTNFREFANSLIQDTVRVITQQLIMRTVLGLFNLGQPAAVPGLGGESASSFISGTGISTGVDFSGVRQFAQGGIATGPASGYPAVLHGTEAVIPLSGSRAIPVQMQGTGAAPIININVDATGTAVQGNQGQAQDLARDLAAVVDDRLVYHRRRGGLLDPQR